jgi:hypothetical protein
MFKIRSRVSNNFKQNCINVSEAPFYDEIFTTGSREAESTVPSVKSAA